MLLRFRAKGPAVSIAWPKVERRARSKGTPFPCGPTGTNSHAFNFNDNSHCDCFGPIEWPTRWASESFWLVLFPGPTLIALAQAI